ncbi:GIY-YIG nuclease family protein [Escherichia coli]|uniref:GIY-YIG nuclease family protein n=1 Tax=Escherichia coli TaxID=562 RepID=UPI000E2137E5|nr:GIY-YIG nuclease family protein [Escherichia coli]
MELKERPHYLYKITNIVNGKMYIGVTVDTAARFQLHCSPSNKAPLGVDIRQYGKENFVLEVMVVGERDYIFDLESKTIALYGTVYPSGYNISIGGKSGGAGIVISKETRNKLSIANSNRVYDRCLDFRPEPVKSKTDPKYANMYGSWSNSLES